MKDPIETAKLLVRTVVRMFYDIDHVILTDALIYHGALTSKEMGDIIEVGKGKWAAKCAGRLKEAGLFSVFTLAVQRAGANKSTNREYYYIDYRRAIDACKYRIHKIDEHVKKNAKPTAEKAEMRCARCKAQYTSLDSMDSQDPFSETGFSCKRCGHFLDMIDDEGQADDNADDTPAKFNKMFRPLLQLMEELDKVRIPETTGEDAYANKIELPRDKTIDPGTQHHVVETPVAKQAVVRGRDTGPTKLDVQIDSVAEQNERQRAQEKADQAQRQKQNAMPDWMSKSTVERDANGAQAAIKQETNNIGTPEIKVEGNSETTTDLKDFFAQVEAERKAKDAAGDDDDEDDDDDDDEDEDDFEDVPVDSSSVVPDAKRIKVESSAAPTPSNVATPASTGDGADESDEDDFEDVK